MTDSFDRRDRLGRAVEQLYEVFGRFRLSRFDGCPCCVSDSNTTNLRTTPLRTLGLREIDHYAFKAMTTWGDATNFRHFLPRIFELVALSPQEFLCLEAVFGKLTLANWMSGDIKEIEAVNEFLDAFWGNWRCNESEGSNIGSILCSVAQAQDDLAGVLSDWGSDVAPGAVRNLARFVNNEIPNFLVEQHFTSAFWRQRKEQERQVIAWLSVSNVRRHLEQHSKFLCGESNFMSLTDCVTWLDQLRAKIGSIKHGENSLISHE